LAFNFKRKCFTEIIPVSISISFRDGSMIIAQLRMCPRMCYQMMQIWECGEFAEAGSKLSDEPSAKSSSKAFLH